MKRVRFETLVFETLRMWRSMSAASKRAPLY